MLYWGKRCYIGVRGVVLGLEVLYWGKRCCIGVRGVITGVRMVV